MAHRNSRKSYRLRKNDLEILLILALRSKSSTDGLRRVGNPNFVGGMSRQLNSSFFVNCRQDEESANVFDSALRRSYHSQYSPPHYLSEQPGKVLDAVRRVGLCEWPNDENASVTVRLAKLQQKLLPNLLRVLQRIWRRLLGFLRSYVINPELSRRSWSALAFCWWSYL